MYMHTKNILLINSSIVALKDRGFFNNKGIDLILKNGNITQKWQLVMTELWLKNFFYKGMINE